jgi:hypothetical protein
MRMRMRREREGWAEEDMNGVAEVHPIRMDSPRAFPCTIWCMYVITPELPHSVRRPLSGTRLRIQSKSGGGHAPYRMRVEGDG